MIPKPPNIGNMSRFEEYLEKRNREIVSNFRDINISLLSNNKIDLDKKRIYSRFNFLRGNKSIINYALSIGGVLTGSRALRAYKINDNYIFDRKANDWDILITKDMMYLLSDKYKFNYNLIDKYVTVKSQFWTSYHSYSDPTRYLANDIHFIIVDNLEDSIDMEGIRVAKLMNILNGKKYLMQNKKTHEKSYQDLTNIIIRLKLITNG